MSPLAYLCSIVNVVHVDECKAAGSAGLMVVHHLHVVHGAVAGEQVA